MLPNPISSDNYEYQITFLQSGSYVWCQEKIYPMRYYQISSKIFYLNLQNISWSEVRHIHYILGIVNICVTEI